MSYAGPTRSRGAARTAAPAAPRSGRSARSGRSSQPPATRPADDGDWQTLAIFGVGVALGIAVGAGAALLAAPRSGAETRAVLLARAGRARRATARRGHDAWDDLRDEIRDAQRAVRRRWAHRRAERDLRREVALDADLD